MSNAEPIIEFVQNEYSNLGVSVKSYGKNSVLLTLPADCTDLSSIVVDLVDQFAVSIDFLLDPDPVLCCWFSDSNFQKPPKKSSQVASYSRIALLVCACVFVCLLLAGLVR